MVNILKFGHVCQVLRYLYLYCPEIMTKLSFSRRAIGGKKNEPGSAPPAGAFSCISRALIKYDVNSILFSPLYMKIIQVEIPGCRLAGNLILCKWPRA